MFSTIFLPHPTAYKTLDEARLNGSTSFLGGPGQQIYDSPPEKPPQVVRAVDRPVFVQLGPVPNNGPAQLCAQWSACTKAVINLGIGEAAHWISRFIFPYILRPLKHRQHRVQYFQLSAKKGRNITIFSKKREREREKGRRMRKKEWKNTAGFVNGGGDGKTRQVQAGQRFQNVTIKS